MTRGEAALIICRGLSDEQLVQLAEESKKEEQGILELLMILYAKTKEFAQL